MNNLALITARSGSKGVPKKNIRPLAGKPLMAYTIEAALQSGMFTEVMVSTDTEEFADVARKYGASVPFLRSAEASADTATSYMAQVEVLKNYEKMGRTFDTYCLLQPTSPLRTGEDIRKAYALYEEKKAVAVTSVCECDHPPVYANTLPESLSMDGFVKPGVSTRRQELPAYYRLNGAIYIMDIGEFWKNADIYRAGCYAYVMDRVHSVDIDAEEDFDYAEFLMKKRNGQP